MSREVIGTVILAMILLWAVWPQLRRCYDELTLRWYSKHRWERYSIDGDPPLCFRRRCVRCRKKQSAYLAGGEMTQWFDLPSVEDKRNADTN